MMSKNSSEKKVIGSFEQTPIKNWFLLIALVLTFFLSAILRAPQGQENWYNSDATYHVLFTMEAYDQTPVSVHKFLPIASYGSKDDKWISWGATVPDSRGNYYYTSFSPAGFVTPYIFIKLFHLPFSVGSLYIFNTLLLLSSWILTLSLFLRIFKGRIKEYQIILLVSLIYMFQTEIMHSQGISYWAQSLFQTLFLCQILLFLNKDKKICRAFFYLLCFINPYVEWTGFISNFGFMLVYFVSKLTRAEKFKETAKIFGLTILSGIVFCLHYIMVIPKHLFFEALKDRFAARSAAAQESYIDLLKGYINSYCILLIIIAIMIIFCLCLNKARGNFKTFVKKDNQYWILFSIPLCENIIMKQHAISYSFDRLKGIFLLILLFLTLYNSLIANYNNGFKKFVQICFPSLIIIMSMLNLYNYSYTDNIYRWKVDYLNNNQILSNYISSRYSRQNSIMVSNGHVRGYINTLFQRGIFECMDSNNAIRIGLLRHKRYVIMLSDEFQPWELDKFSSCQVIDIHNSMTDKISVKNSTITEKKDYNIAYQSNLIDNNWYNGLFKSGSLILFPNNVYNSNIIEKGDHLNSGNKLVLVEQVDTDSNWIRVTCSEKDLSAFAYPNVIEVVK